MSLSFPYTRRGALARVLQERTIQDQYLNALDKNEWYKCDLENISNDDLKGKFIQLDFDAATNEFLNEAVRKSDWIFTQLWHMFAKMFLGWFMTQTSINGWLQRGSMFVISHHQFLKLLRKSDEVKLEKLIDLGAGDGKVTEQIQKNFQEIFVTEVSSPMRQLLQNKSFHVLEIENWHKNEKFDVISCLNLLDRCEKPLEILEQIKSALKPDGLLLLGMVLPFSAYVESGSLPDHQPVESLKIEGDTFEDQIVSLVENVLIPANFEIVSWSRVPYLCEGDLYQTYYWLDDAIFLLKLK